MWNSTLVCFTRCMHNKSVREGLRVKNSRFRTSAITFSNNHARPPCVCVHTMYGEIAHHITRERGGHENLSDRTNEWSSLQYNQLQQWQHLPRKKYLCYTPRAAPRCATHTTKTHMRSCWIKSKRVEIISGGSLNTSRALGVG